MSNTETFLTYIQGLSAAAAPSGTDAWYLDQGGISKNLSFSTFQAITPVWSAAHNWIGTGPQIILGAQGTSSGSLTLDGITSGSVSISSDATGNAFINAASGENVNFQTGGTTYSFMNSGGFNFSTPLFILGSSSGSVILSTPSTGGILQVNGYLATSTAGPQIISSSSAVTRGWVAVTATSGITLTLPTSPVTGQHLWIVMNAAVQTIISASSNVIPFNSLTAGTAIFSAGGLTKFCHLMFNGSNWQMVEGA